MKKQNIIAFLFVILLLGFTACSSDDGDSNPTSSNEPDPPEVTYHSISGTVVDQEDDPVSGFTVLLLGDKEDSTVTNAEGEFSFENLEDGGFYQVGFLGDTRTFNPLTSDQTVKLVTKAYKEIKISGTITDLDGNPVEGVPLSFNISPEFYNNGKEQTSDANGRYEFTVELYPDISFWEIKTNSFEHRYKGYSEDNEINTDYPDRISDEYRATDVVINFKQIDDLFTRWWSEGNNVATIARDSGIIRSNMEFFDDRMDYLWYNVDSDEQTHALAFKNTFAITKSQSGNIHNLELEGLNTNFEGIYEITKADTTWTLKLEVVDTKEGNTPPTVSGGFGSSNNGADGDNHVWTFIYTKEKP